jgi:hypothetical protein
MPPSQPASGKVILVCFPQVEGPTTFERPATGRLDRKPVSVHAITRLEEERLLMSRTQSTQTVPAVLRLGLVYGRGVLLIEAARRLARRRLLCVWRERTLLQLIAVPDYVRGPSRRSACLTQPAFITSETNSPSPSRNSWMA